MSEIDQKDIKRLVAIITEANDDLCAIAQETHNGELEAAIFDIESAVKSAKKARGE